MTASTDSRVLTKFQLLLNKFIIQDHQVVDDTCLEKLLTHLAKDEDGSRRLLQMGECRGFCECALQAFEKGAVSESVLSFALRLHGLVVGDEAAFALSSLQQTTTNICHSPRWAITTNPTFQFALVQMLAALLKHQAGLLWLQNSGSWRTVKQLYEKNSSIYVARECRTFLAHFAQKMSTHQVDIAQEIVNSASDALVSEQTVAEASQELLVQCLEMALRQNEHVALCKLLEPSLSQKCALFLDSADPKQEGAITKIAHLLLLLIFCTHQEQEDKLEEQCVDLVSKLVTLKNIAAVQFVTCQCQIYWNIVKPRVLCRHERFHFDKQIVYIQLMPVMKNKNDDIEIKEAMKHFLEKLCSLSSANTQNVGCCFRKLCFKNEDHQKIACRSIHSLLQLKDVLERETAVCVFQAVMCVLVQVVSSNAAELAEMQRTGLMRTTLEALIKMMDHFHFTWAESVETIDVLTYMQELLCEPELDHAHISPILQIVRRALLDFLPPNLALLTNTLSNSPLQNLGPQLFKCLHNPRWEVRDSALEVVAVIAKISADKFPAFQEHLIEHKLCSLIGAMSTGDEESYVRLSALKCLDAMIAIPCYWNTSLHNQKIPEMVCKILCEDSEGIVRQEAAALANSLILHDRLKTEEQAAMWRVMAAAAATDFHWEVKLKALDFWSTIIKQQLTSQGMIDGRFPEVTFSRSTRRIVTLDQKEVQSRLRLVLEELSKSNCLAVLLSTLHDPDLQVTRKAAQVLDLLASQLHKFHLIDTKPQQNSPNGMEVIPEGVGESGVPVVSAADADAILEAIMESSDLALLASVCRSQLNVGGEEEVSAPTPRSVASISAEEFLQRVSGIDLEGVVGAREQWLFNTSEHLESLLTDMLETREFQHNTNDIDCY